MKTILEDIPHVLEAFSASHPIVSNPVCLCVMQNPTLRASFWG